MQKILYGTKAEFALVLLSANAVELKFYTPTTNSSHIGLKIKGIKMKNNFLKDAFKSYELHYSLDNISTDDGKEIADYTPQEILSEAYYVLSCFYEGGHSNNEWLNSDNKDERRDAQQEVRALKSFIKKYQGNLILNKMGA